MKVDGYNVVGQPKIEIRTHNDHEQSFLVVAVEKIQTRRIVLGFTGYVRQPKVGELYLMDGKVHRKYNTVPLVCECEILLEVKEADTPLTKDDPKLKLSVDKCKRILDCTAPDVVSEMREFIKENS